MTDICQIRNFSPHLLHKGVPQNLLNDIKKEFKDKEFQNKDIAFRFYKRDIFSIITCEFRNFFN